MCGSGDRCPPPDLQMPLRNHHAYRRLVASGLRVGLQFNPPEESPATLCRTPPLPVIRIGANRRLWRRDSKRLYRSGAHISEFWPWKGGRKPVALPGMRVKLAASARNSVNRFF
jgi:hypothetical protein